MSTPSDWDCYWAYCDLCGARYHMSVGGCDCMADAASCGCGKNVWVREEGKNKVVCDRCRTESGSDSIPDEKV